MSDDLAFCEDWSEVTRRKDAKPRRRTPAKKDMGTRYERSVTTRSECRRRKALRRESSEPGNKENRERDAQGKKVVD
jgi:hypothetical protein